MKHNLIVLTALFLILIGCSKAAITYSNPEEALKTYFISTENGDLDSIMDLYGGDYKELQSWFPNIKPSDHKKLLEMYLGNKQSGTVILLNEIKNKVEVSNNEFHFTVTLNNKDGSPFIVSRSDKSWDTFLYTVKLINGKYKILELPKPYQA